MIAEAVAVMHHRSVGPRPIASLARRSGTSAAEYDNESSLSKAFARHHGQAPGQYRRTHRRGLG